MKYYEILKKSFKEWSAGCYYSHEGQPDGYGARACRSWIKV